MWKIVSKMSANEPPGVLGQMQDFLFGLVTFRRDEQELLPVLKLQSASELHVYVTLSLKIVLGGEDRRPIRIRFHPLEKQGRNLTSDCKWGIPESTGLSNGGVLQVERLDVVPDVAERFSERLRHVEFLLWVDQVVDKKG